MEEGEEDASLRVEVQEEEGEGDASLRVVQENMNTVSKYNKEKEEVEEEVEASTVVNYSKEEVKELLKKKKKATNVEVGRVILVNYRPAVLKKRKVKEV